MFCLAKNYHFKVEIYGLFQKAIYFNLIDFFRNISIQSSTSQGDQYSLENGHDNTVGQSKEKDFSRNNAFCTICPIWPRFIIQEPLLLGL